MRNRDVGVESPGTGPLPRLTSLRTGAALAVFAFHLASWHVLTMPAGVSSLGYVGVAFFFVLSGFVLAWGTRPGLPARTFWRRRVARVYPSHLVTLGAAAVLPVVSVAKSWVAAAAGLALVQAWVVMDDPVTYGMNGPSWSLSVEAFFYLSFPVLAWLLLRLAPWVRWGLAGTALAVELLAGLVVPVSAFHVPLLRLPEFMLGVVAGLAFRDGWRPRIPAGAAMLLVAAAGVVSMHLPQPVPDAVLAVPFVAALLAAAGRDVAGTHGWLQRRWLVLAGEASFAFYLVHELVIVNLHQLHLPGPARALIITAVAFAAAAVLHGLVERPANRWIRGLRRPRALDAVPA